MEVESRNHTVREFYKEWCIAMSVELLDCSRQFVCGKIETGKFVDTFTEKWRHERDLGLLEVDPPNINSALSTIFCLVDLYNPEADREEYELDSAELLNRVANVLRNLDSDA